MLGAPGAARGTMVVFLALRRSEVAMVPGNLMPNAPSMKYSKVEDIAKVVKGIWSDRAS